MIRGDTAVRITSPLAAEPQALADGLAKNPVHAPKIKTTPVIEKIAGTRMSWKTVGWIHGSVGSKACIPKRQTIAKHENPKMPKNPTIVVLNALIA
jgi:hypothetical protein